MNDVHSSCLECSKRFCNNGVFYQQEVEPVSKIMFSGKFHVCLAFCNDQICLFENTLKVSADIVVMQIWSLQKARHTWNFPLNMILETGSTSCWQNTPLLQNLLEHSKQEECTSFIQHAMHRMENRMILVHWNKNKMKHPSAWRWLTPKKKSKHAMHSKNFADNSNSREKSSLPPTEVLILSMPAMCFF